MTLSRKRRAVLEPGVSSGDQTEASVTFHLLGNLCIINLLLLGWRTLTSHCQHKPADLRHREAAVMMIMMSC